MNYIREAETTLRYYRDLQISVELMNREIAKIQYRTAPKDLSAIATGDVEINTKKADSTINDMLKLQTLLANKQETEEKLQEIHKILEDLEVEPDSQNYGKALRMWYIEKLDKGDIAHRLNYSRTTLYDIRDKALRKLAVRLYGFDALKVV